MQADANPTGSVATPIPARAKPAATVQYVPPPPGLARGKYDVASGWVIAIAFALLLGVVAFFVLRHRRATRARAYDSVAPQSGPLSRR